MTDAPEPAPWLRIEERKNGWFVIETAGKAELEYGPMPKAHVAPLMTEIRLARKITGTVEDIRTEHLRAALGDPESTPRAFNPAQESQWLQRKKLR